MCANVMVHGPLAKLTFSFKRNIPEPDRFELFYLLALAEGLYVEELDKFDGHFIRVIRAAVDAFLLQEVNL